MILFHTALGLLSRLKNVYGVIPTRPNVSVSIRFITSQHICKVSLAYSKLNTHPQVAFGIANKIYSQQVWRVTPTSQDEITRIKDLGRLLEVWFSSTMDCYYTIVISFNLTA